MEFPMLKPRMLALMSMIFAAAASRLVPHPPNLTAVAAMALFAGAYLSDWRLAFGVPLVAMLLSDALIGFYGNMEIVYASFAVIVAIGLVLRTRRNALAIAGALLTSSVLFFVLTNLGVWATTALYPHTGAGLAACFTAALPFFRNEFAGDAIYGVVLFGGFAMLERLVPAFKDARLQAQPA